MDYWLVFDQVCGQYYMVGFVIGQCGWIDLFVLYLVLQGIDCIVGFVGQQYLVFVYDCYCWVQVGYVFYDVGGQDYCYVFVDGCQQVEEVVVFFWVQVGGGFIDDYQVWVVEQCLGDIEVLVYVVGVGVQFVFVCVLQVYLLQQVVYYFVVLVFVGDVFEYGEVFQQIQCVDFGVYVEILWQIVQLVVYGIFVVQYVDGGFVGDFQCYVVVVGFLQGGQGLYQ